MYSQGVVNLNLNCKSRDFVKTCFYIYYIEMGVVNLNLNCKSCDLSKTGYDYLKAS